MQTWTGYTLSDIHNETESIRTHPENNCSWFREARKIERHSRQAIHRQLHGWTLFENTLPSPPLPSLQGTPRERIQWSAVQETYNLKEKRTLDRNVASSRDTTESSVSKVLSCKQVACKKPLLVTERTESFHLALSTLSSSSFLLLFVSLFLYFPFLLFFTVYTRTICSFIRFARIHCTCFLPSFFYHC